MRRYALSLLASLRLASASAAGGNAVDSAALLRYERACDEMEAMLEGRLPLSIRRAVFLAEWAYLDGEPDYDDYCRTIDSAAVFLRQFIAANGLERYKTGRNLALTEYFFHPYSGSGHNPFTSDFGGGCR